jgi:hypothetical protein
MKSVLTNARRAANEASATSSLVAFASISPRQ